MKEVFEVDEREWEGNQDPCQPEKELLRNVLIRALQDATGNVGVGDGNARVEFGALTWIFTPGGYQPCHFTFDWTCAALSLDPEAVRDVVRQARRDGVKLSIFDLQMQRVPREKSFHSPTRVFKRVPTLRNGEAKGGPP